MGGMRAGTLPLTSGNVPVYEVARVASVSHACAALPVMIVLGSACTAGSRAFSPSSGALGNTLIRTRRYHAEYHGIWNGPDWWTSTGQGRCAAWLLEVGSGARPGSVEVDDRLGLPRGRAPKGRVWGRKLVPLPRPVAMDRLGADTPVLSHIGDVPVVDVGVWHDSSCRQGGMDKVHSFSQVLTRQLCHAGLDKVLGLCLTLSRSA